MRNKVIGAINAILGSVFLISQLIQLFLVYPRLNNLYADLNVQVPLLTKLYPLVHDSKTTLLFEGEWVRDWILWPRKD